MDLHPGVMPADVVPQQRVDHNDPATHLVGQGQQLVAGGVLQVGWGEVGDGEGQQGGNTPGHSAGQLVVELLVGIGAVGDEQAAAVPQHFGGAVEVADRNAPAKLGLHLVQALVNEVGILEQARHAVGSAGDQGGLFPLGQDKLVHRWASSFFLRRRYRL